MDDFEQMLQTERVSLERFVRYRLPSREDADDVLQEIYLSAYQKFPQLKNKASFKAWLLVIARNKCNDYFRRKAAQLEIPVDELTETILSDSRQGLSERSYVQETLDLLGDKDKQILYLCLSGDFHIIYMAALAGGNVVHSPGKLFSRSRDKKPSHEFLPFYGKRGFAAFRYRIFRNKFR